jgi:predicted transcriptional regulator
MSEDVSQKSKKTNDMKVLRKTVQERIARVSDQVREHKKAMKAIREQLETADGTVPELAVATGMASDTVLWYLAAMKKYGQIAEKEKKGGYYRYAWIAPRVAGGDD